MKAYKYTKKVLPVAALDGVAAAEDIPANTESRAAYQWNNALLIAAEKMWGDHPQIPGKFT